MSYTDQSLHGARLGTRARAGLSLSLHCIERYPRSSAGSGHGAGFQSTTGSRMKQYVLWYVLTCESGGAWRTWDYMALCKPLHSYSYCTFLFLCPCPCLGHIYGLIGTNWFVSWAFVMQHGLASKTSSLSHCTYTRRPRIVIDQSPHFFASTPSGGSTVTVRSLTSFQSVLSDVPFDSVKLFIMARRCSSLAPAYRFLKKWSTS